MKEGRFWVVVFASVALTGIAAILFEVPMGADVALRDAYRLLSIFLGVLAGVSLGEYFKVRGASRAGEALYEDLLKELKANSELLHRDVPLRKGFWISGVRSGVARNLPERVRHELWAIYSAITHYNDEFQILHLSFLRGESSSSSEHLQEEVSSLRTQIEEMIATFLASSEQS
ncbi:MAG: hypothetical protein ACP6KW_08755 [Candidatus Thorarchaeota archaeon]